MRRLRLYGVLQLALIGGFSASVHAQEAADTGGFVIRHGRDTVAIERFTRSATRLEGTLSLRNPQQTSERYTAVVAPDATLPLIEVIVREGLDSGEARSRVVQRGRVIFKQDSVAVDQVGDAGLVTRVFATEEGAVPYLNLSFALLEQSVRRARAGHRGSQVPFFNLGGGQTLIARITPLGTDSLRMDIGDTRIHLRLDNRGRLLGATIPVQGVVVDRR